MKYTYEQIMKCIESLGVENTLMPNALEVLLMWKDSGDDVLFPMIALLDNPFTDEAINFMEKPDWDADEILKREG